MLKGLKESRLPRSLIYLLRDLGVTVFAAQNALPSRYNGSSKPPTAFATHRDIISTICHLFQWNFDPNYGIEILSGGRMRLIEVEITDVL